MVTVFGTYACHCQVQFLCVLWLFRVAPSHTSMRPGLRLPSRHDPRSPFLVRASAFQKVISFQAAGVTRHFFFPPVNQKAGADQVDQGWFAYYLSSVPA